MALFLVVQIFSAVVVLGITGFLAYCGYLSRNHCWRGQNIPFLSPFSFMRTMLSFFSGKGAHIIDKELYKKYGPIIGTYSGITPALFLADPELIKLILVKDFNVFSSRREMSIGHKALDQALPVIAGGENWRNIRNTISPAFSSGKLNAMIPILSESAQISVKNFEKFADTQENINCKDMFASYTLDVIANVAFGTKLDSHNDTNSIFVNNAKSVSMRQISFTKFLAFIFPAFGRLFNIELVPKSGIEFFSDLTFSIMDRRKKSKEVRRDFLQIMMESLSPDSSEKKSVTADSEVTDGVKNVDNIKRKPLTKDEALAQCIMFLLAAFDGPATTLSLVLYFLATNPEVQKKVIAEVDRVWEKRETLNAEAVLEAKYIEAVIDETLRISPPALRVERTAGKDYKLGDTGILIPKGTIVSIPVYVIQHDPNYYPEPEKFKPERFYPKGREDINPYTYLTFGQGPRNCIGLRLAIVEMKIILLNLYRNLEFVTCNETTIPLEYVKRSIHLIPNHVTLKVKRR